ncbi:MAG: hypothetical protein P4M09_12585 [Devosia sp.]|nr:hypothetical protein [Devosia sp.]
MRRSHLASVVLAVVALAAPLPQMGAQAAIFGSSAPAPQATLTFKTTGGTLTGKWAYRSIAITGDPKVPFSKMALGSSEFELVEQGGKITGTRPGATKGTTYPVTGFVVYGARKAPQIVLHSTSEVNGKSFDYDYFAFLMPSWNVGTAQPDTFMGTVVRTDPSAPEAPAVVVSFIATRESAEAPKSTATPKPAKPAAK